MPILSVEGNLDAVAGGGHNSATFGTPLVGTPYLILGNAAASFSEVTISKDADGWLTTRTGPATSSTTQQAKYCGISRHFADLVTFGPTTYLYGGVRIKALIAATQLPLVTIHDRRSANMPNGNANQLVILNYLDVPGGVIVSNQEYYFEWAIDMANKKVLRRLDGVRLTDVPFASGTEAALLAQGLGICYGFSAGYLVAGSTVVGYSVRNIYMGERVAGETSDWLGPQLTAPIPLKAVTSQWGATDGYTPLTALSERITSMASASTPVATSDAAATEAALQFQAPVINGKINAVQISVAARRSTAALGGLESWVVDGATETTKVKRDLEVAFGYEKPLLVSGKSPSGAVWTKTKIDGLTLKIQPKN